MKGAPSCAKYIVRSRVCTLTPFFLNLYNRLSRLFAIIHIFYPFTFPRHHIPAALFPPISCSSLLCPNSGPS